MTDTTWQRGKLLPRTPGECDIDQEHLLDVWARQRQRFVAVLRDFGPGDWAARRSRMRRCLTAGLLATAGACAKEWRES
jgi:hypothetical protein